MNYNVAKEGIIEINDTTGNVSASFDEVYGLMDNQASISVDYATNDILCLDTDLGARIQVTEARYYFTTATASGTVIGSIQFLYKDDLPDVYSSAPVSLSDGYYSATFSGTSSPRYVRLLHTVSGTTISGNATGFMIINDDTTVDFGTDGTKDSHAIFTAADLSTISTVAVYNSGTTEADAQVFIEPTPGISDYIFISNSENGPWSGLADYQFAENDFSKGLFDDYLDSYPTKEELTQLKIDALADKEGSYTTRIINRTGGSSFSMLNVEGTFPEGSALKVDATDGHSTYEIRTNTDEPKVYGFYTVMVGRGHDNSNNSFGRDQRWLEDGSLKYLAGDELCLIYNSLSYTRLGEAITRTKPNTGFILTGFQTKWGFYNYHYLKLFRYTQSTRDGTDYNFLSNQQKQYTLYDSTGGIPYIVPIRMQTTSVDGVWVYYQVESGPVTAGYYLMYFDYDLNRYCNIYSAEEALYDVDVVYDSLYLWTSNSQFNYIEKIDYNGTSVCSYVIDAETPDARGICATADGGCWFVNAGTTLYKLDSDAALVRTITDIGLSAINYVQLDKDDSNFLWLVSTDSVSLFDLDNERIIFTDVLSTITSAYSYYGGIALVMSDNTFNFYSKSARAITATKTDSSRAPGVFAAKYDEMDLLDDTAVHGKNLIAGGTASSTNEGTYPSSYAFHYTTSRYYWEGSSSGPNWLKYDMGEGRAIAPNVARIQLGSGSAQWVYVQASHNDSDWIELARVYQSSNQYIDKMITLPFANTTAYRYWRLYYPSVGYPRCRCWELTTMDPLFPNKIDTSWNNKEWKKVSYDSHLISPDEYAQVRLTMRTNGTADPTIDNVYMYDGATIENIYPNQSKDAYIKVVTPVDVTDVLGDHNTNIKVWWSVPVNE